MTCPCCTALLRRNIIKAIILVFLFIYSFVPTLVIGCDCEPIDIETLISTNEAIYYAQIRQVGLVEGRVTPANPYKVLSSSSTDEIEITADPLIEYKGKSNNFTKVKTVIHPASCGVNPKVGEKLFFFVNSEGNINLCNGMSLNSSYSKIEVHKMLLKELHRD